MLHQPGESTNCATCAARLGPCQRSARARLQRHGDHELAVRNGVLQHAVVAPAAVLPRLPAELVRELLEEGTDRELEREPRSVL